MVACYVIDWNRIKKRVFSNLLVLLFLGTASQLRLLLVSWKLTRHMPCPLRLRRDIIRDFGGLQNTFLKRALAVCKKRQCKVTASTSLKNYTFYHQNPSKPIETHRNLRCKTRSMFKFKMVLHQCFIFATMLSKSSEHLTLLSRFLHTGNVLPTNASGSLL